MAEHITRTPDQPWYDVEQGLLDRRIYSDPDIYAQELEKIFARAWNFVCHESQIPEPGNFFTSYIGEDEVIAVRDRNGKVNVLLNTCPHRGNTVCRAELGTTRSFFCSFFFCVSSSESDSTLSSESALREVRFFFFFFL